MDLPPHLNIGEFAVIDTTDRKLQHGELYLKQDDTGRRDRSIGQAKLDRSVRSEDNEDEPLWVLHHCAASAGPANLIVAFRYLLGTCDGHYPTEWLEERLLGRVVGVSSAPLGNCWVRRLDIWVRMPRTLNSTSANT